jgi:hypothetical protein
VKAEGERSSVETMCLQQIVNQTIGQTKLKNVTSWFNLDDSDDYLYVEFETGGYAVFFKENMEMLEYSPTKDFPTSNDKIYYCGPNNVFVKNDKCFKNVLTNETVPIEKDTFAERADNIRKYFSKSPKTKSTIKVDLSKTTPSGESPHPIDDDNPIKLDYGTRISNHTYFEISPTHGYNATGTCGAIAAEMLLTYHNYYSDRRIILNNYLNGDAIDNTEDNPNYCTDPILMTHETLGASGTDEVDDDDSNNYFAKIVKKIPSNAYYATVTSGLKSLLKERKDVIGDGFNYQVEDKIGAWWFGFQTVNTSKVRTEIDNGNPSIVLMQSNLGAYNHYVVAYGYEEYTYPGTNDTYDGFITNFGYGYDSTNIWINSSWICAYITMAVNHEHNYTSDGQITGTLRTKYRCTICGHRTDAVILNNTTSLKRYAENFTNMPLNRDLYNRFNDPDYILKRDYYKYYFFKPTQSGNRLIQTFSTQSTKITVFDTDKKTILSTSGSGGCYNNAFLNYNFESGKVYYIRINLFPLRSVGDIKLAIMPTVATYLNYNSIPHISGENVSYNAMLSRQGVSIITFTPSTIGTYTFTTSGTSDNVLYLANPLSGTEEILFNDDGAGNLQATITKDNLNTTTRYFIIISFYQLYITGNDTSASLNIVRVS